MSELDAALTYRMLHILKVSDRQTAKAYEQACGLSLTDGRCLAAIGTFEPVSVNDLAHHSNLNKANASRSAQALVAQGLVAKAASERDLRGVELRLTPAGRTVWRRAMRVIERRNDEIFACLTPAERAVLAALLGRVSDSLER